MPFVFSHQGKLFSGMDGNVVFDGGYENGKKVLA
jgi:hypothetical protein